MSILFYRLVFSLFKRKKMIKLKKVILVLLVYVGMTSSFNIDASHAASQMLRPYPVRANQQITNPIFFGYDLHVGRASVSPER